jgi:hypothetical protein
MPDFGIMRGFNEKLFGDKLVAGQLPTHLGLIGGENFGIDVDAQAFFDRVTAAGGTLSATEKTAVETLVRQMKADGTWTLMKAIYPMVGASAAACAQNLKSSSFTGTFSSGWTFASTGVTPNGTSAFFDTGLNTSTNLTKTSSHLSLYVRTNVSQNSYDFANASNAGQITDPTYLITRYASSGNAAIGIADQSYATQITSTDSRGFWCGGTNGSVTQNFYKNGTLVRTGVQGLGNFANNNIYLGASNGGGAASFFSSKQYALASIGDGLTDQNASDFYTAVQAFQTTLSRNV